MILSVSPLLHYTRGSRERPQYSLPGPVGFYVDVGRGKSVYDSVMSPDLIRWFG